MGGDREDTSGVEDFCSEEEDICLEECGDICLECGDLCSEECGDICLDE